MTLPNLASLPMQQRWAIVALVSGGGRTYPDAARLAGMSLGTMLTHINRVRENHPDIYEAVRAVRLAQLAARHEAALRRDEARSLEWFHMKGARRYRRRFGWWPWERRR